METKTCNFLCFQRGVCLMFKTTVLFFQSLMFFHLKTKIWVFLCSQKRVHQSSRLIHHPLHLSLLFCHHPQRHHHPPSRLRRRCIERHLASRPLHCLHSIRHRPRNHHRSSPHIRHHHRNHRSSPRPLPLRRFQSFPLLLFSSSSQNVVP